MTKLIGYAPDLDSGTEGALPDCSGVVGSMRGMRAAPSGVASTQSALAAACVGAASLRLLDGTQVTVAGTATKLYTATATAWTDRSGAATFNATSILRWSFAQYGDVTLAANLGDTIQARTSGDFAAVSGSAPKAAFIESVGQFVFAANVNDGSSKPDGWHCSALGDYTDWTASIATQSANGRLTDVPGPFTGCKRLQDAIVLYKRRGIYVGSYVGPDIIWSFQLSSSDVGAIHHNAIVSVEYAHYFMGDDDFYVFDGTRPIPLGAPLRQTVFQELDRDKSYLCHAVADRKENLIYFFYPDTAGQGLANRCVVFNYRNGRWGRADTSIECGLSYLAPSITYADLGTYYSTYGVFPTAPYGSAFVSASLETPAYFDSSHQLRTLTGTPGNSSITTWDKGSDDAYFTLLRAQPRFLTKPTSASMTNYYRYESGDAYVADATVSISEGRFDALRSARWHKLQFNFSGSWEAPELDILAVPDGS